MEPLAQALHSYPRNPHGSKDDEAFDKELKEYSNSIFKLPDSTKAAIRRDPNQAIQLLDKQPNAVAYALVLDTIVVPGQISPPTVLNKVVQFLVSFDPIEIRYAGPPIKRLLENIVSGHIFPATVTVELVSAALLRLDPTGTVFTSLHLPLVRLAAMTATYDRILPLLDCDITSFPQARNTREPPVLCSPNVSPTLYITPSMGFTDIVKAPNVLEYNFLRGAAYISQRNWSKAKNAFELVITHPSKDRGVSKIMTDAHKQWILASLLRDGHAPILPTNINQNAKASYTSINTLYVEVASLFDTPDATKLKEIVDNNQNAWAEDGTILLMQEVIATYQKWQIVNLRGVYTRISLQQVQMFTLSAITAKQLGNAADIVALIQQTIDSGMLRGRIEEDSNGGAAYLVFDEEKSTLSEEEFAREIASSHQRVQSLTQRYKATNENLTASKEYTKHVIREQKKAADKDSQDHGIVSDPIDDEDLMTGILSNQ